MKILVISQKYYPEPFRITDICETLVNDYHFDVTVLCGIPNYPHGNIYEGYEHKNNRMQTINGVKVIRSYEHPRKKSKIHLFFNFMSFGIFGKRKIRKLDKDFDVVFINQLTPVMQCWPGLKYAKKYHKKTILYCLDLWPASLVAGGIKKQSFVYKIFQQISNKIYKKADKILVTSNNFIDYFREVHQIPQEKIAYLPQYCEDLYSNIAQKKLEKNFNFLFAGNVGKMQSVETIIKAASLIKEYPITIHIVGDGSALNECKTLAEENCLNNVIFHGRKNVEEMPIYFEKADALIVSLAKDEIISKTLPGKVQSYMAAGKMIIAAIDGETQTIIDKAKNGYYCDAEDYQQLANLFIKFTKITEEEYQTMCLNSKTYYLNNFEKKLFFEKLINSFQEGINNGNI